MNSYLLSLLAASGLVHTPLPLDTANSLAAEAAAKAVVRQAVVHDADSVITFTIDPRGARATGSPDDPDYAVYGYRSVDIPLHGMSLEEYNRLAVDIETHCPAMRVANVTMSFDNATAQGTDYNQPPGNHLMHLRPGAERHYLEVADQRRDNMQRLRFSVTLRGMDLPADSPMTINIRRVTAQQVERPERVSGWLPEPGRIVYSMTGYHAASRKTAIIDAAEVADGATFRLLRVGDVTPQIALEAPIDIVVTEIGRFGVLDFSECDTPGTYALSAGGVTTRPFAIGDQAIWDPSCWRVLSFIYSMRCGHEVPGVHGRCHDDLVSTHDGRSISYSGGWHDAGDLSQQTLQTADVAHALLRLYERRRDTDPALAARLLEEARWGLEHAVRQRYGDGYRASSMGLLIWQDGVRGTHDDIGSVRVNDAPYDNLLHAAYEAYAARVIPDDPAYCQYLTRVAREDFDFAIAKWERDGWQGWISPYEHTYCTSLSQMMATASWAASMLYELTGDDRYAQLATQYAAYVLACQETDNDRLGGYAGFFYRDDHHLTPVHFIHQSRDEVYALALTELCRTQPESPLAVDCRRAIALYGQYLKQLMRHTLPYGMLPSGVWRCGEEHDSEAFQALHLFAPADAADSYNAQLSQGAEVAPGYHVRRFPIWFTIYNGNMAVHLATGRAAAVCANFLRDSELRDIAVEQLYWVVGKNPFCQSLIYGEGHRYPSLNNFSSGELTGAMPVGIRALADSDSPYWPPTNNACYKEVWITSAGKWLALISEL